MVKPQASYWSVCPGRSQGEHQKEPLEPEAEQERWNLRGPGQRRGARDKRCFLGVGECSHSVSPFPLPPQLQPWSFFLFPITEAMALAMSQPPTLDTLDLLAVYCRSEAGPGDSGLSTLPVPQQPPPLAPLPSPARPAPYPSPASTRGDRKQKKRDQNKSAALRYRQRKRAEGEALEGECQGLEARNRELRERAESVEREIQYVKDLLIEVYKARSQRTRST